MNEPKFVKRYCYNEWCPLHNGKNYYIILKVKKKKRKLKLSTRARFVS